MTAQRSTPYDAIEAECLRYYPDWLTIEQVYGGPPPVPYDGPMPTLGPEEPAPMPWLPECALKKDD